MKIQIEIEVNETTIATLQRLRSNHIDVTEELNDMLSEFVEDIVGIIEEVRS